MCFSDHCPHPIAVVDLKREAEGPGPSPLGP